MKENKKVICFLIAGIIIGFLAGILASTVVPSLKDNNTNKTEENKKEEEKKDENKNDESKDEVIALDDILSTLDLHLKDEDMYDFIHSSSISGFQTDNLLGSMFQEEISNEYKVIYAISQATWKAFDVNYDFMDNNYGAKVSLKKETVEKLAKQIFNDVTIPSEISKDSRYGGIYDISCSEKLCTYSYTTFSIVSPVTNGYEATLTKNGNNYIVKPIYIEYENSNIEGEDVISDIILKDKHNGKTIKTLKQQNLTNLEEKLDNDRITPYTALSKHYSSFTTYTYEFNDENVLLSVKIS